MIRTDPPPQITPAVPWARLAAWAAVAVVLIVLIGVLGDQSVFRVRANETAVILQSGRIVRLVGPGQHLRIPFLQEVEIIDTKRFRSLDVSVGGVHSADDRELEVYAIANFDIEDPIRFYEATGNDPTKTADIVLSAVATELERAVSTTNLDAIVSSPDVVERFVLEQAKGQLSLSGIRLRQIRLMDVVLEAETSSNSQ